MKIIQLSLFLFLAAMAFSCQNSITGEASLQNQVDSVAYAIGTQIGNSFKQDPILKSVDMNILILAKGIRDAIEKEEALLSNEDVQTLMTNFQNNQNQKLISQKQEENELFFEQNKNNEGVEVLPSGLQYKILEEGEGESPIATDMVSVHYRGKLLNGEVFQSTYETNNPAQFRVNGVIPAWTEALQLMKPNAKWELYIPPNLGYGQRGAGPGSPIGPEEALIFEVELLEILQNEGEEK